MLNRWFQYRERGSTLSTEIMAGISTFLALSYIFVVNPAILGQAGVPRQAVFFATVATSAVATLAMALWANLPFVLAPGMEINAYVAFYAVAVAGLTWREALGAVFWSGVLFLVLTLSGVRRGIILSLPETMKAALASTVGALLAAVAFRISGLLRYDGVVLAGLGRVDASAAVLAATTAIVFVLARLRVRGAVLSSIFAGVAIAHWLHAGGGDTIRSSRGGDLFSAIGAADLSVVARPSAWSIVLVLFLVDFYGSVAKLVGLLRRTELAGDGAVPRLREALLVDGVAAAGGSLLGTTSVLVYAESGVGIAAGGRTGLTALTAALAIAATFAAAPLLAYVPVVATTGALLYVAAQLSPTAAELRAHDGWELAAIAGMAGIVVTTFALDGALLFGLSVHLVRDFFRGVRLNPYIAGSVGLLLIGRAVAL